MLESFGVILLEANHITDDDGASAIGGRKPHTY